MHVFFLLAAVWLMPALVIAALYVYEMVYRHALRPASVQKEAEVHDGLVAQRQMRQRSAPAAQPLAVPAHSTEVAHEAQPVRIEVPLLLHDGAGHASMESCVLCLN